LGGSATFLSRVFFAFFDFFCCALLVFPLSGIFSLFKSFFGTSTGRCRLHPVLIWSAPAARQLGRNPAINAQHNDSTQGFFVVSAALPARTRLMQLPSDTTCSLQALSSHLPLRPRQGSTPTSRHVPAAGVGKISLHARERASLNVATVLFRTAVLLNVPHAAPVNVQCGAHSYDAIQ
jgi:hypothetical protein